MSDAAALADTAPLTLRDHIWSYARFIWRSLVEAFAGGPFFYVWMILLTAIALVGANAWAIQVRDGMGITHMSDHVSWGLYISNFTFLVGLAAGGVMMVIPAYLYHDEEMHDVVIIGELLAISAIIMALLFVVVDMGRPDRSWHLIPFIGRFHFPVSMLTWDVIVLNGYLNRRGDDKPVKDRLTAREREVVQLLAEGKTSKEVAVALNLSVKTAETHRTNVMRKLDLHSVADLVRYAVRNNIVQVV